MAVDDDLHLPPLSAQEGLSCQKLCSERTGVAAGGSWVTEAEACRAEMDRIPEEGRLLEVQFSRSVVSNSLQPHE